MLNKKTFLSGAVTIIFILCMAFYMPLASDPPKQSRPVYEPTIYLEYVEVFTPITQAQPVSHTPICAPDYTIYAYEIYECEPLQYIQLLNGTISAARCHFKSWMDWRAITYRNSCQWRMQQIAYTCEDGFRRVDGLYMIALGTYFLYNGVGDVFDITLSSGITFRAVVGDVKDNRHTDKTNRFHLSDGSVVEFIVDRQVMCRYATHTRGDISFAGFPGNIVAINRLPELFIPI